MDFYMKGRSLVFFRNACDKGRSPPKMLHSHRTWKTAQSKLSKMTVNILNWQVRSWIWGETRTAEEHSLSEMFVMDFYMRSYYNIVFIACGILLHCSVMKYWTKKIARCVFTWCDITWIVLFNFICPISPDTRFCFCVNFLWILFLSLSLTELNRFIYICTDVLGEEKSYAFYAVAICARDETKGGRGKLLVAS